MSDESNVRTRLNFLSRVRKVARDGADVTSGGRRWGPAAENARRHSKQIRCLQLHKILTANKHKVRDPHRTQSKWSHAVLFESSCNGVAGQRSRGADAILSQIINSITSWHGHRRRRRRRLFLPNGLTLVADDVRCGRMMMTKHTMTAKCCLALCAMALYLNSVTCVDKAKKLHEEKLRKSGYNKVIRPVVNASDHIDVRLGLKLSQLIDVVSNHWVLLYANLHYRVVHRCSAMIPHAVYVHYGGAEELTVHSSNTAVFLE